MGKASNQEDGVIACTWDFPPARWPVRLVEWQRKGACGLVGARHGERAR